MNNPKITVYDSLIENSNKINAWTNNKCFPIEKFRHEAFINEICVIEISYDGMRGDISKYKDIVINFNSFIKKYLYKQLMTSFLLKVSSKEQKNKIRSYKGIFPNNIAKDDFIQKEFEIENNYSILIGLAKISKTNFDVMIKNLFDRTSSFMILTENIDFFHENTIENIFEYSLNKPSYIINYLDLCKNYCKKRNIIIRENGDGGDQELSWQMFVEKSQKDHLVQFISNIIKFINI